MSEYISCHKKILNQIDLLFLFTQTDMTLIELKILCEFLDRISDEEELRLAQFEKSDFEADLGLAPMQGSEFRDQLQKFTRVIKPVGKTEVNGKRLKQERLFNNVDVWLEEDGIWLAHLGCTYAARQTVFCPNNICAEYLRDFISKMVHITSRHSFVMYLYLELNRRKKIWDAVWDVDLNELKAILQCDTDTYTSFRKFNDMVIKKCQMDLAEKTALHFNYIPVKRSGRIIGLHISV